MVPLIVIDVPLFPEVGVKDIIVGVDVDVVLEDVVVDWEADEMYPKLLLEVALLPAIITVIGTVVLLLPKFGTTTIIEVAEFTT